MEWTIYRRSLHNNYKVFIFMKMTIVQITDERYIEGLIQVQRKKKRKDRQDGREDNR